MWSMALVPLSADELADTQTLFASFMGYVDTGYKTLGQLRAIYRERSESLDPREDEADDLRVERFVEDMASNRWRGNVVMRIGVFDGTTLFIDGIHRGIAYLACIEKGISPARLPALHVDC
jgi:IS4 transposase